VIRRRSILLAGAAALLVTACSWGTFDDLAGTTWVQSNGKPDHMNSAVYGLAVGSTKTNASAGAIVAMIWSASTP
jgi:hypothetical protein